MGADAVAVPWLLHLPKCIEAEGVIAWHRAPLGGLRGVGLACVHGNEREALAKLHVVDVYLAQACTVGMRRLGTSSDVGVTVESQARATSSVRLQCLAESRPQRCRAVGLATRSGVELPLALNQQSRPMVASDHGSLAAAHARGVVPVRVWVEMR